jgi:CHAT domain-containing protein/tetratricopeptide (TPR) repeat protein
MMRKFKKNLAKYLFIITIGISFQCKLTSFIPSYAVEQSRINSSIDSFQQADLLLANGDIQKSILFLDKELEEARKQKNIPNQIKAMHRLQIAHYFQGGGRRAHVYTPLLSEILKENNNKIEGLTAKESEDYTLDFIILHHKISVELGDQSGYGSPFPTWIKGLLERENSTSDKKNLVKIYSGLAYLYKKNQQFKNAEIYYKKLISIDLKTVSMSSMENLSFLLTYIEVLKIFAENDLERGISQINSVRKANKELLSVLDFYLDLNIAYLYYSANQFQESLNSLKTNLSRIDRLPYYVKFLTLELLGDNYVSIGGDLLKPNSLYSQILFESQKIRFSQGSSDFVNPFLEGRVTLKQLRVRYRQNGISNSDISEIIDLSSTAPYPLSRVGSQSRWDDLSQENFLVENILLKKGLVWDAFVVSEVTRGQYTKSFSAGIFTPISSEEYTARYCFDRKIVGCLIDPAYLEGLEIADKNAVFPLTALKIARIVSSQNTSITDVSISDNAKQVKTKTTIIQYSYNFRNEKPTEIHFYVVQPESNLLKVKPIVRCVNLQINQISETCAKYQSPVVNIRGESDFDQAKKEINQKGLRPYIKTGIENIINCKIDSASGCSSKEADKTLKQLYQVLIEPISDLLPTNAEDKVIFIPQGDLFSVPFAALKDTNEKYLIEKAITSIVPSIFLLSYTDELLSRISARKPQMNSNNFLILGNPTISNTLSPEFEELPFAEKEALEVANLYVTTPLLGRNATKEKLIRSFETAKIIHLAAHTDINHSSPLNSRIILSSTTSNPTGEMFLIDIEEGSMKAELVVLSSCRSAQGGINTDGINGFSSKLIFAGNPTQILSLWSVNDESTRQTMVNFHRGLLQKKSKTHALRQAIIATMKTPKYSDPYHWAAFTLVGNPQ